MDAQTPARATVRKAAPSTGKQQSILGFFSKTPSARSSTTPSSARPSASAELSSPCLRETKANKANARVSSVASTSPITPVPSSDPAEPPSSQENAGSYGAAAASKVHKPRAVALPSPMTPAETAQKTADRLAVPSSSPTRKVGCCGVQAG